MSRTLGRLIGFVAATAATIQCAENPLAPSTTTAEPGTAVIYERGWSIPAKLAVSDDGWEDSTYITRDGRYVLFFYHPAPDIVTNPQEALRIQLDGRIYASERPFAEKALHRVSGPDPVSEAGPYISAGGAFYYHRTFPFTTQPNRIVRDGSILDLGTGRHENNPHYCDAMDELYFDFNDEDLLVFKNGRSTVLPEPINLTGRKDFQPFLTDDCRTMYFTSTRGGSLGQIYRSTREGEFRWNEPQLFISDPVGVGEFSMTRDGRQMVFIQGKRLPSGLTTDIYYSERR